MDFEAVKTIAAAEEQAEQIKAQAAAQAKRIIADAYAQGEKLQQELELQGRQKSEKLREEALNLGEAEAIKTAQNAENEVDGLKKAGESNMDKAVDMIIDRVFSWQ